MSLSTLAQHILKYLNITRITPTQYLNHISGAYNVGKSYKAVTVFYSAFSYNTSEAVPGTPRGLFRSGMQELVLAGY